ncbi:ACP phosphodiesterase [Vogesella indigofera]|uniref:ACP phosphodiesterase n=1 Tax=Vogesella indigofera TaxID=45465 RepID=UPI00234FB489|nr:ACP phosphodiesterase [Vogesella indigofera]MDC7710829.1 ACP phosphodiesterase [Vogesella indigofera]
MNFLAHAVLAERTPALMVGGVIGDWIKGILPGCLPTDLAQGVALHRAIDGFVETHPAFHCSRSRISQERRRYAGVLVDIFYDHVLARDWARFHSDMLPLYCQSVYRQIEARLGELPESTSFFMRLMAQENWLQSYAELDGIADVLRRMSQHARRPNPLIGGEAEFLADPSGFAADFEWLLADTRVFVGQWLLSRSDIAEDARALGTHLYTETNKEDVAAKLQSMGCAQAIVATISDPATVSALLGELVPQGRLVVLGVGKDPLPVSAGHLVVGEHSVLGSITGSPNEKRLDFSVLANVRPMGLANEAYPRMKSGDVKFRMVPSVASGSAQP